MVRGLLVEVLGLGLALVASCRFNFDSTPSDPAAVDARLVDAPVPPGDAGTNDSTCS